MSIKYSHPIFESSLKEIKAITYNDSAEGYEPSEELEAAVRVALLLQKPLLVTGEPGTGKSKLAEYIGAKLGLTVEKFICKHNSLAKELLYRYDTLSHFSDANRAKVLGESAKVPNTLKELEENYIKYGPLGSAIKTAQLKGERTVVLIDEIDKAPREFSNDLLQEIDFNENYKFKIREIDETYYPFFNGEKIFPLIIITSNQEKLLPDAFLRRCLYHHIPFPDLDVLKRIARSRLAGSEIIKENNLTLFIQHFQKIRENNLAKKPGTAELLNWLLFMNHFLREDSGFDFQNLGGQLSKGELDLLKFSYGIVIKYEEDMEEILRNFNL